MIKLANIFKETKIVPKNNSYPQIITVIKDGYYISDNNVATNTMVDEDELKMIYTHLLVKGDVWRFIEIDEYGYSVYKCIKGEWLDEFNEGWWSYNDVKKFFYEGIKKI